MDVALKHCLPEGPSSLPTRLPPRLKQVLRHIPSYQICNLPMPLGFSMWTIPKRLSFLDQVVRISYDPLPLRSVFAGGFLKFILCKHTNYNIDDKNDVHPTNHNLPIAVHLYLGPQLRTWTEFESSTLAQESQIAILRV